MPRLVVKLTQHTPILQFQQDDGAGIRGTELKPALDKFLRMHCAAELGKHPEWHIRKQNGENTGALQYRVKIVDSAKAEAFDQGGMKRTGFFSAGGMERNGSVQHMPRKGNGAMITFLSAHGELLCCIQDWIGAFCAATNFGYRKSKGFGSYTVAEVNSVQYSVPVEADIKKALDRRAGMADAANGIKLYEVNPANFPNCGADAWMRVLQAAATVNAAMKSGINLPMSPRKYDRSVLMKHYGYSKGYSNEKRLCKRFNAVRRISGEDEYDAPIASEQPTKFRYARVMLGFADHYTFRKWRVTGEATVYAYDKANLERVKQSDGRETIAFRMESALLFKPVCTGNSWRIFVIQREIPNEIYGREFVFSTIEVKSDKKAAGQVLDGAERRNGQSFSIKTPTNEEFDLQEFLRAVAAYKGKQVEDKDNPGKMLSLTCSYPLLQEVKTNG